MNTIKAEIHGAGLRFPLDSTACSPERWSNELSLSFTVGVVCSSLESWWFLLWRLVAIVVFNVFACSAAHFTFKQWVKLFSICGFRAARDTLRSWRTVEMVTVSLGHFDGILNEHSPMKWVSYCTSVIISSNLDFGLDSSFRFASE